jgi:hypothetical protein
VHEPEGLDYLEFIRRVTWYFPDKSQAMVHYRNFHGNARRGKIWKYTLGADPQADYYS